MARILIVEDEQTDQRILRTILEKSGHITYVAWDGEQAFKTYMKKDIDVVVTDLQMPKVDGLEFIEALRALFPAAAIIAVSGEGPTRLAQAKLEGALAAFKKPVDPEELLKAVADAIAGQQSDG